MCVFSSVRFDNSGCLFLVLGPGLLLGPFVFTVLPTAPLCKNAKRSANALFRLSTYLFVCVCGCSCLADRTQEERRSVGNSYAACVRNLWIKSKQRNLFGHEGESGYPPATRRLLTHLPGVRQAPAWARRDQPDLGTWASTFATVSGPSFCRAVDNSKLHSIFVLRPHFLRHRAV